MVMPGRHARIPPLCSAAMRIILEAPEDDPADTEVIITALARSPLHVCLVLARLMLSGWVDSEWTGQGRVYWPAYDAHWYVGRITGGKASANA